MLITKNYYRKYNYGTLAVIVIFLCILSFAFSCNRSSDNSLPSSAFDVVLDSANRMFQIGNEDEARHYLDSVYKRTKNLNLVQAYNYYEFSYIYTSHTEGDVGKAKLYSDSLLNLFDTPEKKLKYPNEYAQAFFYRGDLLFAENKFNESYQYFYQGKLIGTNNLDNCILSDYSYRMGMILYKQERYQQAATSFKTSSKENGSCGPDNNAFFRKQELLNNIGLCYSKINNVDSALYFYNLGLKYIDDHAVQSKLKPQLLDVARGVIYGNQANIYIWLKNYELAKVLLRKSIEINLRKGSDNQDALYSEIKLAQCYAAQGKNDSLLLTLNKLHQQSDIIKDVQVLADWNNLMSVYYDKINQPVLAMKYFTQYDALKDSISQKNRSLKEADIAEQIKRLEKDNEFDKLKKNNQQQNIYLRVAAVFGVMLLSIISLIFLNWQKSKKNIKVLGGLNDQINKQNTHLEFALDELKVNGQEKDRIMRTVAHDLRNPISGIASLTTAMGDDEYTDDQKEMLNIIRETSFNSLELINEILEAANTATTTLNKEPVDINGLLNNSVELLRFKAAEKDQSISLDLLSDPLEIMMSREKIWRVVGNLISNAIKFSPVGGYIFVKVIDLENEVQVSVKDNGIGIPDKLKHQVFNMFTDAKRPGTEGEKSFGLGLSICQQIIEKHNGRIWFESDTENGTTFYFSLPK
ncbi:Signal transduction histidine kinase [Mucilaginibacter pineti]|uniref:histidine kinase n=1 Tax=Mucilaginibacter pineti TaxID=1391627 RepID=A0A1G6TG87_9SPHI|nr:HAMP domain-containing sensor histidine kinase [Mucilaginibacter pineti]SDD27526.1 Signal transduction histidine kinase [Mucilaginibacter pineti]